MIKSLLNIALLWVVIMVFAVGFTLAMQAAQEARGKGDLSRRVIFYGMSAIVGLLGVATVGLMAFGR